MQIRPRVKRGNNQATTLEEFQVPQQHAKVLSLEHEDSFGVKLFLLGTGPQVKTCTIDMILVDNQGNDTVVATVDFNISYHIGKAYASNTYNMTTTQKANEKGINISAINVKVIIEQANLNDAR